MLKLIRTTSTEATSPTQIAGRLGMFLTQQELLTSDQLRIALEEQRNRPALLGEICVKLGFLEETKLAAILAARCQLPLIDSAALQPDPALLQHWPRALAERHCALPVGKRGNVLQLAVADPYDIMAGDAAQRQFPDCTEFALLVATASALRQAILGYYGAADGIDHILAALHTDDAASAHQQHPIIRLVDHLLADAVRRGVSDIHLEPEGAFVRIRYRIDGMLQQTRALHKNLWSGLSHRVKIMAGMNIAETQRIQDGRFHQTINGDTIDFRVALMPTVQGENIVIRILDHRRALVTLAELGFDDAAIETLHGMAERPQGLTLITGPTGSGKTTTLYALLRGVSDVSVKIATLEEPVEYQLELIRQTAINEVPGLDFASGVRGVLRVDPDIILIGEIRDAETAQMALRAAITGHKVFSTLHSHDGLSALARLFDLGLSPGLLAGNLTGIVSQRLVARLCPTCRTPYRASMAECTLLGLDTAAPPLLYEAPGCPQCHGSGIAGRAVIAEIMPIDEDLDNLISAGSSRATLRAHVQSRDLQSLKSHGLQKLLAGEISLRALRRVVAL